MEPNWILKDYRYVVSPARKGWAWPLTNYGTCLKVTQPSPICLPESGEGIAVTSDMALGAKKGAAIAIIINLIACFSFAGEIREADVLFGIEYSFQDVEMLNEPGRNTAYTPHKALKALEMTKNLISELGLKTPKAHKHTF